jgi:hypothetical protein
MHSIIKLLLHRKHERSIARTQKSSLESGSFLVVLQFVAILLAPTSKQEGSRRRSRRPNLASEILVPSSVSPSSSLVLSDVATVEVAGGLPQSMLVEVQRECLK